MRCLTSIVSALTCAFFGLAGPAAANSIPVSISFSSGIVNPPDPNLAFYTLDTSFTLPANFLNASLNLTTFAVDDRAVLQLNGSNVASTGILANPGIPTMVLSLGGPNDPFTFEYLNSGPFAPITGPFVVGLNTLHLIMNETATGIVGNLNTTVAQLTGVSLEGAVTFDIATTPLPAALPLFAGGLGALGLLGWRRKRKVAALAA